MGANELSALLWRERATIESLRATESDVHRLLKSGSLQEIQLASAEVEKVLNELRPMVLMRDIETATVAQEWDAPDVVSLNQLSSHAPPGPWEEILRDHLRALKGLAEQVLQQRQDIDRRLEGTSVEMTYRYPISPDNYTNSPDSTEAVL